MEKDEIVIRLARSWKRRQQEQKQRSKTSWKPTNQSKPWPRRRRDISTPEGLLARCPPLYPTVRSYGEDRKGSNPFASETGLAHCSHEKMKSFIHPNFLNRKPLECLLEITVRASLSRKVYSFIIEDNRVSSVPRVLEIPDSTLLSDRSWKQNIYSVTHFGKLEIPSIRVSEIPAQRPVR